jgi:adenylate cyclase
MPSPTEKARVVVSRAGEPEWTLEIGELLAIGRSPSNGLVLDDSRVSRRHAEIRLVEGGRYRLTDLGSANGTWVNRRRLSQPQDLQNGDSIHVGAAILRFEAAEPAAAPSDTHASRTSTQLVNRWVVVLVTDIRGYTSMSEELPPAEFSRFVKDWFRECAAVIESRGGTVDKFIGDAVLCYWPVPEQANPAREVNAALWAARNLVAAAERFSERLSRRFAGRRFRIGVGISMGNALLGNVGAAGQQSITIVGDSVNVAFRLESLTKEKQAAVLVTRNLVEWASPDCGFQHLGQAEVKGRKKPVDIAALLLG